MFPVVWNLGFGIYLEFVIWNLEFHLSSPYIHDASLFELFVSLDHHKVALHQPLHYLRITVLRCAHNNRNPVGVARRNREDIGPPVLRDDGLLRYAEIFLRLRPGEFHLRDHSYLIGAVRIGDLRRHIES